MERGVNSIFGCIRAIIGGVKLTREINKNERSLLSLINSIGPLKNWLYIQQATYIAQELDWIKTDYNFDFDLGFPFSNQLEADLGHLESEGMICYANIGNFLVVAAVRKNMELNTVMHGEILKGLNSSKLITISRLLYLRKHPIWKEDMMSSAVSVFKIPPEEIEYAKKLLSSAGVQWRSKRNRFF